MFGNLGFSYIGLIFMVMLTIPNLIWMKKQPQGYNYTNESRILLCLERMGQVLVTCCALFFSDFNLQKWSGWSWWLIFSIIFMLIYEIWWILYFRSKMTLLDFYSSFLGIPVAGATLPVIAFFLLGVYGKVIWLIVSVVILGIGHIGIHLEHRRHIAHMK